MSSFNQFRHGNYPMSTSHDAYGSAPSTATSKAALFSMILGILSFCFSFLTGLPAVILGIIGLAKVSGSEGRLTGTGFAVTGLTTGIIGTLASCAMIPILAGLLLPAVQKVREAAARTQSANNMKQMGVALASYYDMYEAFPPAASKGADGKPLLSWRVAILPFVEQGTLYSQFKLDEPWDSPNNKPLQAKMPKIFLDPSFNKDVYPDSTPYQVFVGKGSIFDPTLKKPRTLKDITDGANFTIMVAESARPVPWTKPEDMAFQPGAP